MAASALKNQESEFSIICNSNRYIGCKKHCITFFSVAKSDSLHCVDFIASAASIIAFASMNSLLMDWKLSLALTGMLAVHEVGHLLAGRLLGVNLSLPIFLPFLGALILLKAPIRNPWHSAVFGISGPLLGTVATLAVFTGSEILHSGLFAVCAVFGALLNLFNLIPVGELDGGRSAAQIGRWIWIPGYLLLAAIVWFTHAPAAVLLLLLCIPQVVSLFKQGEDPAHSTIPTAKRAVVALTHALLVAVLLIILGASASPAFKEIQTHSPQLLSKNKNTIPNY